MFFGPPLLLVCLVQNRHTARFTAQCYSEPPKSASGILHDGFEQQNLLINLTWTGRPHQEVPLFTSCAVSITRLIQELNLAFDFVNPKRCRRRRSNTYR